MIEINKSFQIIDYIKKHKLRAKIHMKRTYTFATFFALIAFAMMIYENIPGTPAFENDFGLTFTMLAVFLFTEAILYRRVIRRDSFEMSKKIKGPIKYLFTDEEILYTNNISEIKHKWTYYTHFIILKEYIIISNTFNEGDINNLMIRKDDVKQSDQNDLLELLCSKLVERKSKIGFYMV